MNRAVLLLAAGMALAAARAEIPPPAETPAKIVVNGNTSTAVDIKIVAVGQEIPATYAGDQAKNTPGFSWYVSEHYALKSSMDEAFSREMLEVSELAHPHWLAVAGGEPPDPRKRMYVVYARDNEQLRQAMISDIGTAPGGFQGGFTLWTPGSYNLPGGTLRYHLRGLVIHENLHQIHMLVNNTGGTEDLAYSGEQHVYDPQKKQLTVFVYDHAPINNHNQSDLATKQRELPALPGGASWVTWQHFCMSDPDRYLKWQIWRDEFTAGNRAEYDPLQRATADIFGPLEPLNEAWLAWLRQRRTTFHHVDWGWEQDGNAVWAYGFPGDGRFWSQMDIDHEPGEKPTHDPLRMDYPTEPMPPIVGPVARGVEEPTVGFVISGVGGGSWGGFGLGVDGRELCQVVIAGDRTLVIDGSGFGIARQEVPLPAELIAAAAQDGGRHGVTIRIGTTELEVTVRAGAGGELKELKASAPLTAEQRERLLSKRMALVGRNGYPRITPWIDDARKPPLDLSRPAPANLWRFDGLDRLAALTKAAWRLQDHAPAALVELRAVMLQAVDQDPATQARAIEAYEARIRDVFAAVRGCAAEPETRAFALADLVGVFIAPDKPGKPDAQGRIGVGVRLISRLEPELAARVSYASAAAGELPPKQDLTLLARRPVKLGGQGPGPTGAEPTTVTMTIDLDWRGETISVPYEYRFASTSIPRWQVIGPFDRPGDSADAKHPIEPGAIDTARKVSGKAGEVGWRKVERDPAAPALADHAIDLVGLCGQTDQAVAYAVTWIDSDTDHDVFLDVRSADGFIAWLDDREVYRHLPPAGTAAGETRVSLRLRQGRSQLLLAIPQHSADWSFTAHLLDHHGRRPAGIRVAADQQLSFSPPAEIKGGEACPLAGITFIPLIPGSTVSGSLFHKARGEPTFSRVPLEPAADGGYTATIPAAVTAGPFEYYLAMQEAGGREVFAPDRGAAAAFTATPDLEPPTAVGELAATGAKSYRVTLAWKPATDDRGVAECRVYRGPADGFALSTETLLATLPAAAATYADDAPTPKQTAWYAVQAIDVVGRAGPVTYLKVDVPAPAPPANTLAVTATPGSRSVAVAWSGELDPIVTALEIMRGRGQDGPLEKIATLADPTAARYIDQGLEAGATYCYAVCPRSREGLVAEPGRLVSAAALHYLRRVNCGGPEVTAEDGVAWEADDGKGGPALRSGGSKTWKVKGTVTDAGPLANVYGTERWATRHVQYAFPVEPGRYEVVLLFAETSADFAGPGKRTFDIRINGETVAEKVDVFAAAGAALAPWQFRTTVDVAGRELTLGVHAAPTGPAIKGIEIRGVTAGDRD